MVRDAAGTEVRLLESANREFARFGIAGARIDRIAVGASANKSLIYAYFGNKDALFDLIFSASVKHFYDTVRFDARNLARWAGEAFDYYDAHEDVLRLATWYQLERPSSDPYDVIDAATAGKLSDIESAQADGLVTTEFSPLEILTLVRSIAMAWQRQMPRLSPADPVDFEHRRQAVVDAIVKLIAPLR